MKEKHEKETALKMERDLQAKDSADREAAEQVHIHADTYFDPALFAATTIVMPVSSECQTSYLTWHPASCFGRSVVT